MSRTSEVPAEVPLAFQGSTPAASLSSALKKMLPAEAMNFAGRVAVVKLPKPRTSVALPTAPVLFQRPAPPTLPLLAAKYNVLLIAVMLEGELLRVGCMFATI